MKNTIDDMDVSDLGHEIRNSINTIVASAKLLAETTDDKLKSKYLNAIEEHGILITQLLDDVKKEDTPDNSTLLKDKPLVLIAEDDIGNFKLENLILKSDFRIIHAWDGSEAIEMFNNNKPDIILMDINMPVVNGYQAFEKIRAINKDVPVIAVTAYAMANEKRDILDAGFNGYISKPIDIHTFKDVVSKFL